MQESIEARTIDETFNRFDVTFHKREPVEMFIYQTLLQIQSITSFRVQCWLPEFSVTADGTIVTKISLNTFIEKYIQPDHIHIQNIKIYDIDCGHLIFEHELNDAQVKQQMSAITDLFNTIYLNKLRLEIYWDWHFQLHNVLKSMTDCIALFNTQRTIVYQNESFLRFLSEYNIGKVSSELEMIQMLHTISETSQDQLHDVMIQDNAVIIVQVVGVGKTKHFEIKKYSVHEENMFFGFIYSIRDITKEHEIDLIKSNLISIASHEFKTPLTSIRGSVETLMRDTTTWDEQFRQELLEGIHEDVLQLQELIDLWMDVKKIETGTLLLYPDYFPIFQLIRGAIKKCPTHITDQATISFDYDQKRNNPLIYGDEARLQQVIINLIINGVTYNDAMQKKIAISVHCNESHIYIYVKDNGIGISHKHVKKIFERFFRVDISATRKTGGSGLGLSICQGLIRQHHGEIYVESELGKGSTFTIELPIVRVP